MVSVSGGVKWSSEMDERLKALAAEALSGSRIAERLNAEFRLALTRCAVAGRVARLGLSLKSQVRKPKKVWTEPRETVRRRPAVVVGAVKRVLGPQGSPPELKYAPWGCKWLGGAPEVHEECSERAAEGRSYCHAHMMRVYLPLRERKKVEAWLRSPRAFR